MAATKVILANVALNLIGVKPLAAFGENTTAGNAVSAVYDDIRDEVLEEAAWTFAQKRAALVDKATRSTAPVTWGTGLAYAVSDYVRNSSIDYVCVTAHTAAALFATDLAAGKWVATETIVWTDDGCTYLYIKPSDYLELNECNYPSALIKVESNGILSNTGSLKIGYTYSNDSPSTYSRKFTTALATRLAAALCFTLTNSTAKGTELLKLYVDDLLPSAISSDSQQGSPIQAICDEWENVRLSGGGGYATTPAGQTWHPL